MWVNGRGAVGTSTRPASGRALNLLAPPEFAALPVVRVLWWPSIVVPYWFPTQGVILFELAPKFPTGTGPAYDWKSKLVRRVDRALGLANPCRFTAATLLRRCVLHHQMFAMSATEIGNIVIREANELVSTGLAVAPASISCLLHSCVWRSRRGVVLTVCLCVGAAGVEALGHVGRDDASHRRLYSAPVQCAVDSTC